jgi:PAS domain S-box-containing protein
MILKDSTGPLWMGVLTETTLSTSYYPYTESKYNFLIHFFYFAKHVHGFLYLKFVFGYTTEACIYFQIFSYVLTNYLLTLNISQYELWKKLVKNLDRSENILDSVQSTIIQLDQNMNIVYMNRSFLNYNPMDVLEKNVSVFSFFEENLIEDLKKNNQVKKTWKSLYGEKFYHFSLSANSIRKSNEVDYCVVINDITDTKNLEEQEMLKIRAITSLKAKTEFIASISHEIRNPLQVIGYCSEILSSSQLNSDSLKAVDNIKRSNRLLKTIIGDILDMSKIEAGKMNLTIKKLNIKESIENAIQMNSHSLIEKKLKLFHFEDLNLPLYFDGDESRLVQVMNNFISNSVKYTETGFISIFSSLIKKEKKYYFRFECKDTGIGIKRENIKTVFYPFEQVHE